MFHLLMADPGDSRTLEDWGRTVGASARTLARRMRSQTGMTFRQWRQQVRILEGLRRLALDEPVTTVALDLGYDSPSAFISMFKKALGKTPGQFFRKRSQVPKGSKGSGCQGWHLGIELPAAWVHTLAGQTPWDRFSRRQP